MKNILLNSIWAFALSAAVLTVHADTIVVGEPDYVGDFTGVSFVDNTGLDGNDLDIDSGWHGNTPRWTISNDGGNDIALRDLSAGGQFNDEGMGIVFAAPSFTSGVLSFDYDATGATTDNSGLPNFVLYAMDDVNPTANKTAQIDLSQQNFSNSATEGAPATITGDRYTFRLIQEWKFNTSDAGTFNSGTLDLVPSGSTDVTGYIFAFRSNSAGGDVTLDNVALAVPEPSTLLLSVIGIGLAGGCNLFRRRRD